MTRSFRILALDDDPAMQALFPLAFRNLTVQLTMAGTESEAQTFLTKEVPDLFLVDYCLGDSNGLEAAERLLRIAKAVVPIIVVTAESGSAPLLWVESGRCLGYLMKPICLSSFGEDVLSYLGPAKNQKGKLPAATHPGSPALVFLEAALRTARGLYGRANSDLLANGSLAQAAHKWIGISGIDGLPEIAMESRVLEKLARSGDWEQLPAIRQLLAEIICKFEGAVSDLSAQRDLVV